MKARISPCILRETIRKAGSDICRLVAHRFPLLLLAAIVHVYMVTGCPNTLKSTSAWVVEWSSSQEICLPVEDCMANFGRVARVGILHVQRYHPELKANPVFCTGCREWFKNRQELREHTGGRGWFAMGLIYDLMISIPKVILFPVLLVLYIFVLFFLVGGQFLLWPSCSDSCLFLLSRGAASRSTIIYALPQVPAPISPSSEASSIFHSRA